MEHESPLMQPAQSSQETNNWKNKQQTNARINKPTNQQTDQANVRTNTKQKWTSTTKRMNAKTVEQANEHTNESDQANEGAKN